MKKFILIASALLFAAVFMSGCVTETDDPVIGIWQTKETTNHPSGSVFDTVTYVFKADGTGFCLATFADELVSARLDFTWKNLGGGKYERSLVSFDSNSNVADTEVFTVEGGKLFFPVADGKSIELVPAEAKDYVTGLWTSERGTYEGHEGIKVLFYLAEDGTGNVAVYGPSVAEVEDVFTSSFTWEVKDDVIYTVGDKNKGSELPLVDGGISYAGLTPLHKYTVQDHFIGLWMSDEQYVKDGVSYDLILLIKSDGTGTEIWTIPDSHKASFKYQFTWEMTSPYSYKAVYDDGDVWEFNFGSVIQIFDGETWYSKVGFDVLGEYAAQASA